MMKKKLIRYFSNKSVAVTLMSSYIIILAVSFVINLQVSLRMSETLKEELFNSTNTLLIQAQNSIDTRLEDVTEIAKLIGRNTKIKSFFNSPSMAEYPLNKLSEIIVELGGYQSSNGLIKQIYIFPKNMDMVISCNTILHDELYQRFLQEYSLPNNQNLASLFENRHQREFMLINHHTNATSESVIGFLQTLPDGNPVLMDANLLIIMNRSSLMANFNHTDWMKSMDFFVINEDNEIFISSSDKSLPENMNYQMFEEQSNMFSINWEGNPYTVVQTTSAVSGWKYIALVPDQIIWGKLKHFQFLMWSASFIILVLGTTIAFFSIRRHYRPLLNLIQLLKAGTNFPIEQSQNEYRFLQNATSNVLNEYQKLGETCRYQSIQLKEYCLTELIKKSGQMEQSKIQKALTTCGIELLSNYFLILVLYIPHAESDGDLNRQDLLSQKLIAKTVFLDALQANPNVFIVDVDNVQAIIINFPTAEAPNKTRSEILAQTAVAIQQLQNQDILITVSSNIDSVQLLSDAYIEAYTLLEYCILMNKTGLQHQEKLLCGNSNNSIAHYYYYPSQIEAQLINHIRSGNLEQAQEIMNELFRVNFEEHPVPFAIARSFMLNLVSTINRVIYDLNLSYTVEFENYISQIDLLLRENSLSKIRAVLNSTLTQLCRHAQKLNAQDDSFINKIKTYIDNNYTNDKLSVSVISEYLSISSSYLSRKFKQCMGIGLLEYINKHRIDVAKMKLQTTQDSIADIAKDCGYYDSNTFIRVFKKYEGITPGKFRETATQFRA